MQKSKRATSRRYLTDRDRDTARSSTRKARKGGRHTTSPSACLTTTTLGGGHLRLRDCDLGKNGDLAKITYGETMARVGEISLEH